MAYVGRPDVPDKDIVCYIYADFHVECSAKMWIAKNQWRIDSQLGLIEPGEMFRGREFEGEFYDGVNIMLPPRHGKTDVVVFDSALDINKDDRQQMAVIHASQDVASSRMLVPVRKIFDRTTSQGRRNARLFPDRRLASYDNNATKMRVHTENPAANANLIAGSPFTRGLGNNLNIVRGDDLVPSTDRYEAGTREQRKVMFKRTWVTRLQGRVGLIMLTGYPHHHEDLVWSYYTQSLEYQTSGGRSGLNMLTVRRDVGGPKSSPRFSSIWPEMYDSKWLERKYHSLNDPATWASNYQLKPMPDDMQIVQKVRLYDPTDPDIIRFLDSATYYLSVDPAATGELVNDKAGLVILAVGDLRYSRMLDNDREEVLSERIALVVKQDEFHATQTELTEHMLAIASNYNIEAAIIEQVTGLGTSMAEMLEQNYGINDVRLRGVQNKNKAARLRAVAPVVEHSNNQVPARVAFPGIRTLDENGVVSAAMVPSPDVVRLVRYIEQFHVEQGFHSLDAFTQCVRELVSTGEIAARVGGFSNQLSNGVYRTVQSRKLKAFAEKAQAMRDEQNEGMNAMLLENTYNCV